LSRIHSKRKLSAGYNYACLDIKSEFREEGRIIKEVQAQKEYSGQLFVFSDNYVCECGHNQ
jgi:hypothetical protein